MKRTAIILTIIIIPIILISALGYVSMDHGQKNGFIRKIKSDVAVLISDKQLGNKVTAISGVTDHTIYLNTMAPQGIFELSMDLKKDRLINLNIRDEKKISDAFSITIDSPNVQILAGNIPSVFSADINDGDHVSEKVFKSKIISEAVPYANDLYIIRVYAPEVRDFVIKKINSNGEEVGTENNVSILKHDDGMSTQGTLSYSQDQHRLYYVYKLFNTILCLDTNLNLVYKSHTIDTFAHSSLKTSIVKEGGKTKGAYGSPPRFTNRACRVFKDNLYVCSLIKADNEQSSTFLNNSVIDVYKLADGQYKYSFYLPHKEGKKMTDFTIDNSGLVALYNHSYISIYNIKFQ